MASETTKFESCQALFCSLVDNLGISAADKLFFGSGGLTGGKFKYETYHEFIQAFESGKRKNKRIPPSGLEEWIGLDKHVGKTQILKNRNQVAIAFANVDTPGMSLDAMEAFLMSKKAWFHSSVVIAVKLLTDLGSSLHGDLAKFSRLQRAGMQTIDYVRGDKVTFKTIGELFKIAKTNAGKLKSVTKHNGNKMTVVEFGDPNKWNPADIYYVSPKGNRGLEKDLKKAKKTSTYCFNELNELIIRLMASGDLLPLSLKKQTSPESVKLALVNFSDTIRDQRINAVHYGGIEYVSYPKQGMARGTRGDAKELPLTKSTTTRDLKVIVNDGDGAKVGYIQMRHDPSGNGSWKVDFKYDKAEARAGSVVSATIFTELFKLVDSTAGGTFLKKYDAGSSIFLSQVYSTGPRSHDQKGDTKSAKVPSSSVALNNKFTYFGEGGLAHQPPNRKTAKNWSNQKRLWQIPFQTVVEPGTKSDRFKSSAYDFQKGEISVIAIMNRVGPFLKTWFQSDVEQSTAFVRVIFQYVTSRHPSSSRFVIAK